MALAALGSLFETVAVVKEHTNPDLEVSGILACKVDSRTRHALEVVEKLREQFGKQLYRTVIRRNVRLAEASAFRKPIATYDPHSAGAEDYWHLAGEIIRQER
jgi:chromosome partitioning protein